MSYLAALPIKNHIRRRTTCSIKWMRRRTKEFDLMKWGGRKRKWGWSLMTSMSLLILPTWIRLQSSSNYISFLFHSRTVDSISCLELNKWKATMKGKILMYLIQWQILTKWMKKEESAMVCCLSQWLTTTALIELLWKLNLFWNVSISKDKWMVLRWYLGTSDKLTSTWNGRRGNLETSELPLNFLNSLWSLLKHSASI